MSAWYDVILVTRNRKHNPLRLFDPVRPICYFVFPPGLTLTISTFRPRSVFVYFVLVLRKKQRLFPYTELADWILELR